MSEAAATKGFVYVLSNPSMPGILKIGKTTRTPEQRVSELNAATGVPTPFRIEAAVAADDVHVVEANIHDILRAQRVNKNREFFQTSVSKATSAARKAAKMSRGRFTSKASYKPAKKRNGSRMGVQDIPFASAISMTLLLYPTMHALHPYAGWGWLIACLTAATIGTPPLVREYLGVLGRPVGTLHILAVLVGLATFYPPIQEFIDGQLVVLSELIVANGQAILHGGLLN